MTKKKLWVTYAWADNEDKDIDFILGELQQKGLDVRFDRICLVPGRRLWDQIAKHIEDQNLCDAWAIVLTPNSLKSGPCMEEMDYAHLRALETRQFPLLTLMHKVFAEDLPIRLRTRLGISLKYPNWADQVVAGVSGTTAQIDLGTQIPFVVKLHPFLDGSCYIEVRPRVEHIAPFCIGVEMTDIDSGNFVFAFPANPGTVPSGVFTSTGSIANEDVTFPDGTEARLKKFDIGASPVRSIFVQFKTRPRIMWCGEAKPNGLLRLDIGRL